MITIQCTFQRPFNLAYPGPILILKGIFQACPRRIMKRPFEPIPEPLEDAENAQTTTSKREYPKRKVAMIMGYSGTGYQGMQR